MENKTRNPEVRPMAELVVKIDNIFESDETGGIAEIRLADKYQLCMLEPSVEREMNLITILMDGILPSPPFGPWLIWDIDRVRGD